MSLPQASSNPLPQRKPKRAVKGQDNPPSDGIYSNKLMVHSVMLLTGYQVDVELIDSSVWTGVLRTVSPEMAIVLSVAHLKKENTKNKQCLLASHDAIRPHLVIPFGEVVTISASQVDTPYLDSFKTDVEIGALNGTSDRSLKPFTDFDDEDSVNNFSAINETSGGWSVEDMLKANKNMFNVKSTYTDDLQGYTTQLESSNTPEYLLRQRRAERLAQEIEDRDRHYKEGEDTNVTEEDKYSSVVRSDQQPPSSDAVSPTHQSSSPTSQRQQDSGFAEQLCDLNTEPLTTVDSEQQQQQIHSTSTANKITLQEQENNLDASQDDVIKGLKDFSTNFNLASPNGDTQIEGSSQTSGGATTGVEDRNLKSFQLNPEAQEFKLNPEAQEFNPVAKLPPSPTTSYNNTNSSGRRNSRGGGAGGRGYNHHYQQQQPILATIPTADYMAMQPAAAYMASSYPANQMMPMYQTIPQQQQQQVTSPRQHPRFLQSSQMVHGGTYFDGMTPLIVQQQAAMMSQLPGNRQTMVATAPTQPVYIIPQHQGATTMPHAPTVAFQPAAAQYATLTSPQLPTQYMPYQM